MYYLAERRDCNYAAISPIRNESSWRSGKIRDIREGKGSLAKLERNVGL